MFISPPPKRMDTFEWRKWLEQLVNVMNQARLVYRSLDLSSSGLVIKASPGRVYGWSVSNISAAVAYAKLYNKATQAAGTDTPVLTLPIPIGGTVTGFLDGGIAFSAGIGLRGTTLPADADATSPTANTVIANIFYI